MGPTNVPQQIEGLYTIIPLKIFRRTPGVSFDCLSVKELPRIDSIDRVIHVGGAVSPGPVGDVERPWYMHPHQADNLMVLQGKRYVEIYTPAQGKIVKIDVTVDQVIIDGQLAYDGPGMLVWPCNVFHRIRSCPVVGSASVNYAVHYEGFNIRSNFNVYDLNVVTGEYKLIREGYLDQPVTS